MKNESPWLAVAGIFALLFVGMFLGEQIGRNRMKKQAVAAGVGAYRIVDTNNGLSEFYFIKH